GPRADLECRGVALARAACRAVAAVARICSDASAAAGGERRTRPGELPRGLDGRAATRDPSRCMALEEADQREIIQLRPSPRRRGHDDASRAVLEDEPSTCGARQR